MSEEDSIKTYRPAGEGALLAIGSLEVLIPKDVSPPFILLGLRNTPYSEHIKILEVELDALCRKYGEYKAGTLFPTREAKPKPSWQSKSEEIKKKTAEKTEAMSNLFKQKSFDKLRDKFEIEE